MCGLFIKLIQGLSALFPQGAYNKQTKNLGGRNKIVLKAEKDIKPF